MKKYLKIEDDTKNGELNEIIINATYMLDTDLWGNIGLAEFKITKDSTWRKKYRVNRKIKELISVKFHSNEIEVESHSNYYIYLSDNLVRSENSLEITFTSWFEATPPDLEEFFLYYCKQVWNRRNDSDKVKNKKIWEMSVTYFSPQENENFMLLHTWKNLLKKYKIFNYYVI